MTKSLWLTFVLFLLSSIVFGITITQLDPLGDQYALAFLAFFVAIFLGGTGLFTLIFFFGKELFAAETLGEADFQRALRRGCFVGGYITILLLLQLFHLLGILEFVLLTLFFILLECIFLPFNLRPPCATPKS